MLRLNNITVRNTLVDLNLIINKGEFVLVTGDNGAGKTTLFNTISGHVFPKSGTIVIDGQDVSSLPQYARAAVVSNVLQDPRAGTVGSMTIRENLNIAYMRGKCRKLIPSNSFVRDDLYREKLSILKMDLENRLDDYVENLSGGQRQALSIIMSIIVDSKILLFDEITAALDPKTSDNIMRIAREVMATEHKTCLMITHNVNHMDQMSCRRLVIKNGKLNER
ncbi:ABC transporter ATP-binding protein [Alphaproteobacteria bacterium]|nr:ABC transporter ATP-binding protein [Alphaproteobacteria bacterium]